jgi:hypothetical protein
MALQLTTLPLPLLLWIAGFFAGKASHIHSSDSMLTDMFVCLYLHLYNPMSPHHLLSTVYLCAVTSVSSDSLYHFLHVTK